MARRHFSSQALVLIVISIAINMIGGQLASMVKLPIFLDSIGTLISAVLLGPVIGMLTGLLTNLLWGLLTDPIAAAFAPVAMVIGLVAGWLARAGWFRTLPKVVVSGVIITLAVTVVAVPLRTALFGGVTGSGADLFVAWMHSMGQNLVESVAITVIGSHHAPFSGNGCRALNASVYILNAVGAGGLHHAYPAHTDNIASL